jgi:hypothetical protein
MRDYIEEVLGMKTNTTLAPGYYLGIRRSTRNFSFTVPKIGQGVTDTDMDKWFNQLNSGKRVTTTGTPSNNPTGEKSTSFSGWIRTDNAVNLSAKCLAAPEIYKAAGGDDPNLAQEKVKSFKKKATAVLSRCCDTQEAITEATAAEINTCACCVHEIKVVILCVSNTERPGFRHDSNTNLWYMEKTVRKFYLSQAPTDSLIKCFARELADPDTSVNAERKLVAVRADKTTPRTGRNARTSSFSIRSISNEEAMATDAKLLAAVQRIKAKMLA